jgi:hypothetical protein
LRVKYKKARFDPSDQSCALVLNWSNSLSALADSDRAGIVQIVGNDEGTHPLDGFTRNQFHIDPGQIEWALP